MDGNWKMLFLTQMSALHLFYSLPQIWENSPYVMGNSCSILQRPHNFFFFQFLHPPR